MKLRHYLLIEFVQRKRVCFRSSYNVLHRAVNMELVKSPLAVNNREITSIRAMKLVKREKYLWAVTLFSIKVKAAWAQSSLVLTFYLVASFKTFLSLFLKQHYFAIKLFWNLFYKGATFAKDEKKFFDCEKSKKFS